MKGFGSALLLVDLITDFDFEDGEKLFDRTRQILPRLKAFKQRCFEAGMPILYVNDPPKNRSQSADDLVAEISRSENGRFMLSEIGPVGGETIIIKPHRSGFYETILESTLNRISSRHIYISGVTTDICVLFTAHDAYMRHFKVSVPSDCVTAVEEEYHIEGLKFLSRITDANISPAVRI